MKKIPSLTLGLFLFLAALSSPTRAQQPNTEANPPEYFRHAADHAALYRGKALTRDYRDWAATPYWSDDNVRRGRVQFHGVIYPDVLLRFNTMEHHLEVQTPDRKIFVLPKQEWIDWFEMDSARFVRRGDIFVREEFNGDHLSVELLRRKVRTTDQFIEGHAITDLKTVDRYQLRTQSDTLQVRRLSQLYKLFPQYKPQLKEAAARQRWSSKSKKLGASLTQAAALIEQQLQRDGVVAQRTSDSLPTLAPIVLPDSVLLSSADESAASSLPAYAAFRQGGATTILAEAQRVENNDGISELDVLHEDHVMNEVEIMAFRSNVGTVQMGAEKFRPEQLRNIPMALGEADVMKMVQTLPGVSTLGEISSGFNVRGGAAEQNLILLNGATIYNPMHMFGLFSVVNTDAVNDVELYKASLPAEYGGRLSSVMNITARNASKKEWHGSASIGLLTSKAQLEMPLVKNRLSLLLTGRTTYSDWLLRQLPEESGYRDGKAGFYDLGATLSWMLSERHYLNVHAYHSADRFSFLPTDRYTYTNNNINAEWKAYWNDRQSGILSIGADYYGYQNSDSAEIFSGGRLTFRIRQIHAKWHFQRELSDNNTLRWGAQAVHYQLEPGTYSPLGEFSVVKEDRLDTQKALETSVYLEDEWKLGERWKLTGGLRGSVFSAQMEDDDKNKRYLLPEIRLSAAYSLTDNQSLKASFNTSSQSIHKVSNTLIMSPTDTWQLSNKYIRPQKGWQVAAGYYARTDNRAYEFSAELYYKGMSNYLTYRSAARLVMNHELENDVIGAQGRAYGLELQVKKPHGKLNGWISYAYSQTQLRQKPTNDLLLINHGDWFAADCDRPHQLNVVANYKFTRRYSVSANFDYATGRPTTFPAGKYYDYGTHQFRPFYTQRNVYRLPDNMRLDLSFNIEPSHHITARAHCWFSIGAYNVLARHNVYNVFFKVEYGEVKGYKMSIFGCPIPFVSFNIRF